MISIKTCKAEKYFSDDLDFESLVKYLELFRSTQEQGCEIKFSCYLKSRLDHNGIANISYFHDARGVGKHTYNISSSMLSLIGSNGVFPSHYTDFAIAKKKEGDASLSDFLDIFYNRIMTLLYRVIKWNDLYLNFQQCLLGSKKQTPRLVSEISSYIGIKYNDTTKPLHILLGYGGGFAFKTRPAFFIKAMLSEILDSEVDLRQFIPLVIPLKDEQKAILGRQNSILGVSFYIGSNIYLYQNKILIKINHLNLNQYEKIYSSLQMKNSKVINILNVYLGYKSKYEIQFDVDASHQVNQLSGNHPAILGKMAWCRSAQISYPTSCTNKELSTLEL
ncbi:type VI secretion system baseplate subunit TssG [Candidatus Sneabacter namystus]|uniref:Type VI secretion system baseplate subunit TssG n=1 Tax=Candidatus Sneabacter namystus TaxID=2601646 RepID=A0A5C0UJI1_9RICK|nr:type VI secretion system baseplate subunit TssG [Candidatus Sneabacter namystus]QEK39910.1 type VI secretion system baseplate subunit TssG [Candidatus Sneabacter namystus]